MIDKAIEHINAQVREIGTSQARIIGKYLVNVVSTDIIAVNILREDKSVEGFLDKIKETAAMLRKNDNKSAENVAEAMIKDFGGDECNASEFMTPEYKAELSELIGSSDIFNISSEVILPFLHAYYNIPLSDMAVGNVSQPKLNKFKRVSLD